MDYFDVFISYKHTDASGEMTEDYNIGAALHAALTERNIRTFFSDKSLFSLGVGDYKKAIDTALDSAMLLIVIGTSLDHLNSPWVEYEYETFYEDVLGGRKKNGSLLSYTDNISSQQLPRTLSRFQNFSISQHSLETVTTYVENHLQNTSAQKPSAAEKSSASQNQVLLHKEKETRRGSLMQKSVYSSDYSNELNRLRIQACNSISSDQTAIRYILDNAQWTDEDSICVLDLGSAYGYVAQSRFSDLPMVDKVLCVDNNSRVIERAKILFAENQKMVFEELDIESENFTDELIARMEKHNIKRFDIVFSALTLHHLRNPNRVLRNIRRMMTPGAYIMLRGSDDGSKLCYPESELMESIIAKTMQASGVSDRINGRKIYTQLFDSGFQNIRIFSEMRDLSHFEYDDRRQLFQESFSYRINYYKKALEANPNSKDAVRDYEWMEDALEMFEDQFYQRNFWYCEYDYIGIAQK